MHRHLQLRLNGRDALLEVAQSALDNGIGLARHGTLLGWVAHHMNEYLRFRDAFAEALDGRLYTIEYLDWLLAEGKARLWSNDKAAIVAGLKRYPTGALVVHGIIAAGDREEIRKLIPLAEQWGREQGCIGATIESRAGWARTLRQDGYGPFQTAIWKDL